jgi:hypothetical protein
MSHVRDLLAQQRNDLNVTERMHVDAHLATCDECRALQADLARTDRLLKEREAALPVAPFDARFRPRERATPLLLAAAALGVLAVVVLAPILGGLDDRAAAPTAPASPAASASPPGSPTTTPSASPPPPGTFESPILGYRITLPVPFRLQRSIVIAGHPEILGTDVYTTQTEADERAECLRDAGDIPGPAAAALTEVAVHRNPTGATAVAWSTSSPRRSARQTVEPATIDGRDAARVVEGGTTAWYAIRANDRVYVISPTIWPTQQPLDSIASSFRAIAPRPFPTPTATPAEAPRESARRLADALARAFAARDADAVARVMPECHFGVAFSVDGVPSGGVLNRSVARFIDALRERFASADFSVTVEASVLSQSTADGERFFARSQWRDGTGTTLVDLELGERDGRWLWVGATHHYQRQDLIGGTCAPYRSPWVTGGSC